jgi:hypothetical protein
MNDVTTVGVVIWRSFGHSSLVLRVRTVAREGGKLLKFSHTAG